MNKQTEKEKAQETQIDAETHTFAHTDIPQKHKHRIHSIYAKGLYGGLDKVLRDKEPSKNASNFVLC